MQPFSENIYLWIQVLSNIHKPATSSTIGHTVAKAIDEDDPINYQKGLPVVAFRYCQSGVFLVHHSLIRRSCYTGCPTISNRNILTSNKNGSRCVKPFSREKCVLMSDTLVGLNQTQLRAKGWIVPNYGAPPAEDKTEMLRVVGMYLHLSFLHSHRRIFLEK